MSAPTPKERGLIKGALRRVFSRSELRRRVLDAAEIKHSDPKRPRVTKWVRCAECKQPTPKYLAEVDHVSPVVPYNKAALDMTPNELVDALWCDEKNLRVVDKTCHRAKSLLESKMRREHKRSKKK